MEVMSERFPLLMGIFGGRGYIANPRTFLVWKVFFSEKILGVWLCFN
jgi:hypothetical protein